MLTKKDLSAIQRMMDAQFETQFKVQKKDIEAIIQRNTDDLIAFMTANFNSINPAIADHENRITLIEEKVFKSA